VSHLLGLGLDRQKTVAKRLWSLSSFWRYLIRKGHADANVWLGHGVNQHGRSSRDRVPERAFAPAEIHKLLDGPAEPVLADLMRLALFSGARIEELALLRAADINVTDRTMALHADPKSAASRRIVPVHAEVWPIVAARIEGKAADAFILDELGAAPRAGRQRSMAISKRFGRYRTEVGVDDRREGQRRALTNFHSFRRTFVTLAEQAGQPESIIRSVVGHKRDGVTLGLYSGGPSLAQRRACVESVKLPAPA
jgi:integrase